MWNRRLAIVGAEKSSIAMKRSTSESAVDRLIALASAEKPPENGQNNGNTELEAVPLLGEGMPRELEHNPMWKALLQFRVLVPYVSRLLEMSHPEPSPSLTAELKHSIGELANSHRDLRLAVQEQVVQMKHLEEELARTRETTERNASENLEIVDDVRSVHSLIKKAAIGLGGLVVVLLGLVVWLLDRIYFHIH
jgi:hypothetical protein